MDKKVINQFRYFLKDSIRQKTDFAMTDQNQGIAMPPIEKPTSPDARKIDLVQPVPGKISNSYLWKKPSKIAAL